MKSQKTDLNTPLRSMEAPTGIKLRPDPPATVTISKRAAIIVLGIFCCIAAFFGYGIHQRQDRFKTASLSTDDDRKIVPATNAAKEITRDIPTKVLNLADEQPATNLKTESGAPASSEGVAGGPGPKPYTPILDRPYPQNATIEQTPEERRLAAAYERELQAIAAPTAIQSAGGTALSPVQRPNSSLPSNGAVDSDGQSAVNALLQSLAVRNGLPQPKSDATTNDQNPQSRNESFLARAQTMKEEDYLKSVRTPPLSKYEIKAGWEIPAVMEQDLNSDLPGELKALVTANVYDTATGRYLLIPQGSRMVGTYDSSVAYGQNGLQVVWNRIIFPDASSIDLRGMVGQDAQGASGFRQDVDNHYKRLVGLSVLSSVFSAGFQLSQSRRGSILQNPSAGEIAANSVGQEVSQLGTEITRKNLNIQPTIKVPVGYRFNVRVNRDILFDGPYI